MHGPNLQGIAPFTKPLWSGAYSEQKQMALLEVRANGQRLDIQEQKDLNVAIERQIFDFQDPTSQGGDRTFSVTFPATKNNRRILGANLTDVDATRKFVSVQPIEIEIFADGQRVFVGTPEFERVGATGYEVTIYGRNIDWAQVLQQRSLRDLTTLPDVPFIGSVSFGAPIEPTGAMVQSDFWPLLTANDTVVQFPPVCYGNFYAPLGLATGLAGWRADNLEWQDIPPCVFVLHVVRAMFKEAGLTLISGFFDSPDGRDLITAYTGDTPPHWNWGFLARANASNTPYTYRADLLPASFNFDFSYPTTGAWRNFFWRLVTATINWDYSESYFQSSPPEQYITPVSGTYRFTITTGNVTLYKDISGVTVPVTASNPLRIGIAIVIVPDDPDDRESLEQSIAEYIGDATVMVVSDPNVIAFYDFGTGYQESPVTLLPFTVGGTYSQVQTGIAGNPGARIDGSGDVEIMIENVNLPAGTRVEFWLISQWSNNDPITNQSFVFDAYEIDVKETSYPDLLKPALVLPDVSQFDYFKWLVTAFDLLFSVDQDKALIRIETRDRFYRSNDFAADWTSKGSDIDTPSRPIPFYKSSHFRWATDSGDYLQNLFGTERFNSIQSSNSRYAINEKEVIEVGFAPTYERLFGFTGYRTVAPEFRFVTFPCMGSEGQFQTIQSEIEWDYNYAPRLLRYVGLIDGNWTHNNTTYTQYPAARFSHMENGAGSLCFDDKQGWVIRQLGIVPAAYQGQGLFKSFWDKFFFLRRLGHIQEVSVYLNPLDFAAMDVSTPILFHGIHYWLYSFVDVFDPIEDAVMRIDLIRQA